MPEAILQHECLNCNSFATEDPSLVVCPVCGNAEPGRWRAQARCAACKAPCTGPFCPACLEKMTPWQRFLWRARDVADEGRLIARETWAQTARLWSFAVAWLHCQLLGRDDLAARLELGRRMAEHHVGDPSCLKRLAELDARLGAWRVVGPALKAARREREGFLLALAAGGAAAAEPPASDLGREHLQARSAAAALEAACAEVRRARAEVFPAGQVSVRRLAVGYGVVAAFLLVLLLLVLLR